jgi:hypothetical protein
MKDPRRLLDGDGTDAELLLLQAGVSDEPPAHGKRHLLAALGLSSVLTTTTTAAASGGGALLSKAAALLGTGIVLLGVSAYLATRAPAPPNPAPAARAPHAAASVTPAAELPALAASAEPASSEAAAGARRRSAPQPTIAAEIAALDRVRSLLRTDPSAALAQLARYGREFPRGALRQEARLLQIEALVKSGQREAARSLAQKFLRDNPNTPHAHRVRSLAGLGE